MFTKLTRSFGNKLLLLAAATSATAVALVCGVLIPLQFTSAQQAAEQTLTTHATMISAYSTAAMRFDDNEAGRETLAAMQTLPDVVAAEIRDNADERFASYHNQAKARALDLSALSASDPVPPAMRDDLLVFEQPIVHDGEQLGTLVLWYDMRPTYAELRKNVLLAIGVGLLAMAVSLILAMKLRWLLETPLRSLVETAERVSHERDYSLRALKVTDDELGALTTAFNGMLDQIEVRDRELEQSRDTLEERVRERTAELEEAKTRAEAANEAKTAFLANMSHEIRTPMTAILGYSDLLNDPDQSASERLDNIQTIRRNGQHLLALINDVLDLSKIEAGRMTVEQIRIPIIQLVAEVTSLMRMRAGETGLPLNVVYDGPIP